jgi:Putative mono-oxygenase ydhR
LPPKARIEISEKENKIVAAKILQVNFKLKISTTEYGELCQSIARAFAEVPGLQWKVGILNEGENEAGGVYLFESEQALTNFLSGPLAAKVKSMPALYDLSVKSFDVMEQVTATTRGPVKAMAAAR